MSDNFRQVFQNKIHFLATSHFPNSAFITDEQIDGAARIFPNSYAAE